MKIRIAIVIALAFTVAPTTQADDSEKLDAILKELRELKNRVERLEKKVEQVSTVRNAPFTVIRVPKTVTRDPYRFKPLPSKDVEEVLRLQIQSPGSLLKGIHERERTLRNRMFLPDVVPQSYHAFP